MGRPSRWIVPDVRRVDAGGDVERGGFPRPIGADQRHQFPLFELKIEVQQCPQPAEVDRKMLDLQQGHKTVAMFTPSAAHREVGGKFNSVKC